MRHLLVFAILCGLCFTAYSNGLHNAFMWDDGPIFSDIKIKNIKYIPNAFFFHPSPLHQSDTFVGSNTYYRPMAYVMLILSYSVFGDNPFGYHALNLFLFVLMSFSVYIVIDTLFKNKMLAVVTALIFAVHPINAFYVDYVTSSIHSVRFICMLMGLLLFVKYLEGFYRNACLAFSLFLFIVALLCHETSFVFPFYIVLTAFWYIKLDYKTALLKSSPYWLVLLIYLFFRFLFTGLGHTLPSAHVNPVYYVATFSRIMFLYVSKLLCPQGIVFFWNSPWMIGSKAFIWLSGFLAVLSGWLLLYKKGRHGSIFFGVTWLLLGFIPVFWAAFPPYDKIYYGLIVEPQWLTFASMGFFLILAWAGLQLGTHWKKAVILSSIALLVFFISLTRHTNEIWGDEYSYYFYWSQQISPLPPVNNAYLAGLYIKRKEYGQARYYFLKAVAKKPDADIYYNVGLIDMSTGHFDQAALEFQLAIKLRPNFARAYNNLGVIYFNEGKLDAAKEAFKKTVELDSYSIEAGSNLGLIALMQKDYQIAVNYYQQNLTIVPNDQASLLGLAQAYKGLKK